MSKSKAKEPEAKEPETKELETKELETQELETQELEIEKEPDTEPGAGKPAEAPDEAVAEDGGAPVDAADAAEAPEERDPEAEIAELNDKLLRSLAETENLRRRARKEREDTANYAVAGFARDLLSVADNLGRALGALPENLDPADD